MPLDSDVVRTVLFTLLVGGVAGLAIGGRYMRDAQGVARDASRVIKATRPPASAPAAPATRPPAALTPQAPQEVPAAPAARRREG